MNGTNSQRFEGIFIDVFILNTNVISSGFCDKGLLIRLCWVAICCDFVEIITFTLINTLTAKTFSRSIYLSYLFLQGSKIPRGMFFVVTARHYKLSFLLKLYLYNVYTSEKDEFLERAS